MALNKCEDCPCLEKKLETGFLAFGSYYWCNRSKTRRNTEQEACSWAKEEDRRGRRIQCES